MDETAIAFELPHVRAAATAVAAPLDRISVRDYTRQVEIGAFQSERGVTQRIRFNVVLEVSHHDAAQDDDVDKVVSYDTITDAIEREIAAERINLLETLAERVAGRVLADPRAVRVFVRLEKLDRIPGTLGVEIARSRAGVEGPYLQPADAAPRAERRSTIVLLAPHVARDPAWRDAVAALGGPVAVVVGPEAPQPRPETEAQRRIGLLAVEQAAWQLADADRRFAVVGSRTEFDWARKGHRLVVWAPTHMAMAVLGGAVPDASDPVALAAWFAREVDAERLAVAGLAVPEGVPAEAVRAPEDLAAFADGVA